MYETNLTQNTQLFHLNKKLYEVNLFKQNYYGNLVTPIDVNITTYTD
jgi:hypothetical protein